MNQQLQESDLRDATGPTRGSAVLTVSFATVVSLWTVAYVCRLPFIAAPPALLVPLLLIVLIAGGAVLGRYTRQGLLAPVLAGLLVGLVNLLILASVISSDTQPNELVPSRLIWIPGSFLAAAALMAGGHLLGRARRPAQPRPVNWTTWLAITTIVCTGVLIIAGGLVTGKRAGLAVVDWPNTFTWNMFLYPLSRMSGDIYYEHAHRLLGTLAGLTTLVLAVHLWMVDRRRSVRLLAVTAVLLVSFQGILGGLRVTGRFTLSADPNDVAPSIQLAIVHGVVAHIFLGLLVLLAAMTTNRWRRHAENASIPRFAYPGVPTDRFLAATTVVLLIVQLVLGAITRHMHKLLPPDALYGPSDPASLYMKALILHIVMAAVVLVAALALGLRAMVIYKPVPLLASLGRNLNRLILLQLLLGIAALVAVSFFADRLLFDALITTAHQTVGAILLVIAVLMAGWTRVLLTPAEMQPQSHRATPEPAP